MALESGSPRPRAHADSQRSRDQHEPPKTGNEVDAVAAGIESARESLPQPDGAQSGGDGEADDLEDAVLQKRYGLLLPCR